MPKWIPVTKIEGVSSRQAHADLPENTFERELGQEGFFGPATQMHHRHPPTAWTTIEGPLKPRAFDTTKLNTSALHPFEATPLLYNTNVNIRHWLINTSMQALARNSDGDELIFIHNGSATLYCDYGTLNLAEGDFVVLPRGTMWRIDVITPVNALLIEATNSHYKLPDKGLLGHHAIFDPSILDTPAIDEPFITQQAGPIHRVIVKRHNQLSTIHYPFNPLDAVGWHGDLMPVKLNWRDIRPIMSHRYHVPPSVHTTFIAHQFIVCTFCPRPIESDPGALKVPFFHNNDDYDEVIFYHQGEFFSRDNIHPGMLTLHPSGITHGPHPNALKSGLAAKKTMTNEVAIMVDTRDAMQVAALPTDVEWTGYVNSWKNPNHSDSQRSAMAGTNED